jgi:hypothetical protein
VLYHPTTGCWKESNLRHRDFFFFKIWYDIYHSLSRKLDYNLVIQSETKLDRSERTKETPVEPLQLQVGSLLTGGPESPPLPGSPSRNHKRDRPVNMAPQHKPKKHKSDSGRPTENTDSKRQAPGSKRRDRPRASEGRK